MFDITTSASVIAHDQEPTDKSYIIHKTNDIIAKNPSAIKLYHNLGFEQSTDIFLGFNEPGKERPEAFSMRSKL